MRRIAVSTGGTTVTAVIAEPPPTVATRDLTVLLAHGAGNDMNNPFLSAVHAGLAERGYVCVKFNFPYKERGGRAPDPTRVLERCYRDVLEIVRKDAAAGRRRIVIGGKSLGGRMASHLAAAGDDVTGLLLLGYPLHPAGKRDRLRDAHLSRIRVPMLFFAGTRDALCDLDLLRPTLAKLTAPTTLHIVEGGNHSFEVLKSLRRTQAEVWDEIIDASACWLESLP